jgi:hypothetical protein
MEGVASPNRTEPASIRAWLGRGRRLEAAKHTCVTLRGELNIAHAATTRYVERSFSAAQSSPTEPDTAAE